MRDTTIAAIPLYPESRDCKPPTTARVIQSFEPLSAHELWVAGEVVASFDPTLSKLRSQVLHSLDVPATAYWADRKSPLQLADIGQATCGKRGEALPDPHFRRATPDPVVLRAQQRAPQTRCLKLVTQSGNRQTRKTSRGAQPCYSGP